MEGMEQNVCETTSLSSPFADPDLVVLREKLPVERKRIPQEDAKILAPPAKKKGGRKKAKVDEEEKIAKHWTDEEIQALIHLRGEMNDDFIKNAKKQGVDMWARLQARLLCVIPSFKKTPKACKTKYLLLFTEYKYAKSKNEVSGHNRHDCKYYENFDTWWSESGSVMKHVSATTSDHEVQGGKDEECTDSTVVPTPSKPSTSNNKGKFHDEALTLFSKMVDNNAGMLQSFPVMTALAGKLDQQMDRLIDKL